MSEEIKMSDVFAIPVRRHYSVIIDRNNHQCSYSYQIEYAAHAINNHDRLVEENKRLREKLVDIHEYVSMIPLHLTDEKTHSNEHIKHFVNQIKLLSELGGE